MNRRDFLKGLAAALAVPLVSRVAELDAPMPMELGTYESFRYIETFNPEDQYGNAVTVTTGSADRVSDVLIENARAILPRGTRFYVMFSQEWPSQEMGNPLNEYETFSWYYTTNELSAERRKRVIAEVIA